MAPPSARPRDKGGTDSSAKDYQNSNSTSARFLGGLQKSWMTTWGNPAQTHALPMPNHGQTRQQTSSRSLEERPRNQQYHAAITGHSRVTCPGSRQSASCSQSPANRDSPSSRCPHNPLQVDFVDSNANPVNVETILPSPAPSDECRPIERDFGAEVDIQASNGHTSQVERNEPEIRHGDTAGWGNGVRRPDTTISPSSSNVTPQGLRFPMYTPNVSDLLDQSASLGKRKRLGSGPAATGLTATPTNATPSTADGGDSEGRPKAHYKPSDERMNSFLGTIISRQQQRFADQVSGGTTPELARLSLLQQACSQHDHHYLLIHQVYCMYPRSPSSLQQLVNVGFHPEHVQGLVTMTSLLLPNDQMADSATDWFAAFPAPFAKLNHEYQVYRETLQHVKSCLSKLAHHWVHFQESCIKRSYPPFVDELVDSVGVVSPILQTVVFRAIHKDIWIGDKNDPTFLQAERLILENQHTVQQRSTSWSVKDRQADTQKLIMSYRSIQEAHLSHLRTSAPNAQTSVYSSQNRPMLPPSNLNQETQATQHPFGLNPPSSQARSPFPSNINTQLAQHAPRHPSGTGNPYIVPSHPFSPEQHSPLGLQNLSRALSASPSTATSFPGPQSYQARGIGITESPGGMVPSAYTVYQHPQSSSNARSPTNPWAPPVHPTPARQNRPLRRAPNPPSAPVASPTTQSYPGHATGFNPVLPPSAQRPNTVAQAMYQRPLLPPSGQTLLSTAQPNPAATALHQYDARSPVLTAMDYSNLCKSGTKYFRCTNGVTVLDDRLKLGSRQNVEWRFFIDEAMWGLLSGTSGLRNGSLPVRPVEVGSAFSQLRCIDATTLVDPITENDWLVARHIWPSHIAVLLNGRPLDVRKKLHYGRDLPLDLTALTKKGENILSVSIIQGPKEDKTEYAVGVESVRLLDTRTAKASTGVLPYAEARQRILQRLQNKDPEIEVVNASITLNLTDPHSSRIWDIPMRGKRCLHDQCFDLDTFLQTRSSRRVGQPCEPDQFKCPICDADARPQSLVRDEFFDSLREMLVKMNRLDAKQIIMQQDGRWRIKEEEKTGESGDGSGRLSRANTNTKGGAARGLGGYNARREEIETIELDD
ncbi:MAG: hypothetical protein LQ346_000133 [Caloplaca aetnensis]|nr:MAG: hypothetical protein LQ346_000133 [Caloplaca aetnensis]